MFENDRFLHSHWQMSPSGLVHKPLLEVSKTCHYSCDARTWPREMPMHAIYNMRSIFELASISYAVSRSSKSKHVVCYALHVVC